MALSFFALILLAVFGLLVVGGIAALCNRRTRWLGVGLLLLPVVLGVLLVAGMSMRHSRVVGDANTNYHKTQIRQIPVAVSTIRQNGSSKTTVAPAAKVKSATPKKFEAAQKSGHVVGAIGTALGKALVDLSSPLGKGPVAKVNVAKVAVAKSTEATSEKTPSKKTPPPKKSADTVDKKADLEEPDAEADAEEASTESKNAEQIGKMVEVLSVAVQKELPEDVEIDQFTALRALGKLLGRMIASEQQEAELDTKKTSAVAVSAEKAGTSNEKRPPLGKSAKAPAKSADSKKSPLLEKEPAEKGPDWVDARPQRVGDGYQVVFVVGPYTTRLECEQEMNRQLARAVGEYAVLYLCTPDGGKATLETSYLRDHVLKDQWEEIYQSSVGPMVRLHARLLFDGKTNSALKASYRKATIEERLWMAGGGLGVILLVMGGCFAVLKFDQATEGGYRGRMVFAVFFGVVMATSVLGTRFLISLRPVEVPVSTGDVHEISTDTGPIVTPSTNVVNSTETTAANPIRHSTLNHGGGGSAKLSFLSLFVLALPTSLLVVMLFFRKTRKIALILLSLGVVLVVGALFLVA